MQINSTLQKILWHAFCNLARYRNDKVHAAVENDVAQSERQDAPSYINEIEMVRVFNRYLSLRNTLYFFFENSVILFFLVWGTQEHLQTANLLLVPLICQISLYYQGLHPDFPHFSLRAFWIKHLKATLFSGMALFVACLFISPPSAIVRPFWLCLATFPFLVIGLRLGYQVLVKTDKLAIPVLVIGSGSVVEKIREAASRQGGLGFRMVYFNWNSSQEAHNRLTRLKEVVDKGSFKKIVIAINNRRRHFPVDFLLDLRVKGIEIVGAISFYEQIAGKFSVDSLKPSDLIFCEGFRRATIIRFSKRMIDLFSALLGLILAFPFFIILPILIKLTSQGSILYRQERIGEKGKPFTIFKFRSMYENAESETGPIWANENDLRVTRVGKIMRLLRLDELPQLINVIKGDMSLVGPRPERKIFIKELEKKIPYYQFRLAVKPGLTGWAQVKYRYGASKEDTIEKLQYDLYYVKHLSPFFDITILFETIRVVLAGHGAR